MLTRLLLALFLLAPGLAVAANPAAEAAYQRATDEGKQGQWVNAAASYQSAIAYDPNMALAYRGLGYSYFHLGRKADCIHAYERYLQLAPSDKAMADYVQKMRATVPDLKAVPTAKPVATPI